MLPEISGVEETAAGARVANPDALADNSEAFAGDIFIAAKNDDGARTHVLFFADDRRNAFMAIVGEGFGRMLEQAGFVAGLGGRHCRRKIDEPFGIGGEAAHDFERGHGVFFADGDVGMQPRSDEALADYVCEIEKVVVSLLRAECWAERTAQEAVSRARSKCGAAGTETSSFSG